MEADENLEFTGEMPSLYFHTKKQTGKDRVLEDK